MNTATIAPERRHTLHFLGRVRSASPIFIDTDVDMTAVVDHRATARHAGTRYSYISYALHVAARVLAAHPRANSAVQGRLRPRVARYPSVTGKVALDSTLNGERIVLSAILPGIDRLTLPEIQRELDRYRRGDPGSMPEFAGVRTFHRLPWIIRVVAYWAGARSLRRRPSIFGTLAVTSLGHRPVDGVQSVGGTTITLGLGRVREQPVARAGRVTIAPMMRLTLTFDHRVVDGAEAADVLTEIKDGLESFAAGGPAEVPGDTPPPVTTTAGEGGHDR